MQLHDFDLINEIEKNINAFKIIKQHGKKDERKLTTVFCTAKVSSVLFIKLFEVKIRLNFKL